MSHGVSFVHEGLFYRYTFRLRYSIPQLMLNNYDHRIISRVGYEYKTHTRTRRENLKKCRTEHDLIFGGETSALCSKYVLILSLVKCMHMFPNNKVTYRTEEGKR